MRKERPKPKPMLLKHWSSAGLCITDWCSSSCALCYMCCSPRGKNWMSADFALSIWSQLREASPRGCRVHVTGGEVFGNWKLLIEILTLAKARGLTPLEKVETNAFWATDDKIVRKRIAALDAAGMRQIGISSDPFHQRFVPIENPRRLAEIATEMLGADRVHVRWADFLNSPDGGQDFNKDALVEWISAKYERLTGRAGEGLAKLFPSQPVESFDGQNCRECLMRGKHVHISPEGLIFPGVCAGIVLGGAAETSVLKIREKIKSDYLDRPVLGSLVRGGPAELLDVAKSFGFKPQSGYPDKCNLCWKIRKFLVGKGLFPDELAPEEMYENAAFQA